MDHRRPAGRGGVCEAAPLDLHEGICDPRDLRQGCGRWPEHLRLLNETTGELVLGRCRATNLCRYCQRLYVLETVEMLTLDAMEYAPTLWAVLTAREHLTREQTYSHLRQLRRAVKARYGDAEWFVQVEFQRRGALHLNLLIKGVPVEDVDELRELLVGRWCARVDAERVGQFVDVIEDGVGVVRYISKMLAHGLKAEQAPPLGWKGHRTSQTKGYLVRPASVMREEARRSLRLKRLLWKGRSLEVAELELQADELVRWSLRAIAVGVSMEELREWASRSDRLSAREGLPSGSALAGSGLLSWLLGEEAASRRGEGRAGGPSPCGRATRRPPATERASPSG